MDKTKKKKSKKMIFIPILIVMILISAGVGGYIYFVQATVKDWSYKIFPGITINGIDVSGKNRGEAISLLDKQLKKIESKNINVQAKNKTFTINFSELNTKYNIEETVDIALSTGKSEGMKEQYNWIKGKYNKEIETHFTYSDDKIQEFKEKIKKEVNSEPKEAKLTVVGDKINITESSVGYTIDEAQFDQEIYNNMNGRNTEDINIVLTINETKPKATKELLSKVNGKIGSFTTTYRSVEGRDTNLKLATQFCDGKVVMPGEVFSYNEAVGKRSYERGFKDGGVFVNNKLVQDVGGGICQVSTTLYRAAMQANLRSVERHNHSKLTSYSEPALDATVAWGALDYKFKNTYSSPIYIQGIFLNDGKVTFNIYGNVEEKGNKTYDLVNEVLEKIPVKEVKKNDSTLPKGTIQVVSEGTEGVKAKSYFVTYENGKEIKRELISTDIYNGDDREILVGTGEKK